MKKILGRFMNTATQTLAANGTVAFTTNTMTNGLDYNNGIVIKVPGTYKISASFTLVATAANSPTITMLENGTVAPGATASGTASAIGDCVCLSIEALTTVKPTYPNSYATITFTSAVATSYSNAVVIVEKID